MIRGRASDFRRGDQTTVFTAADYQAIVAEIKQRSQLKCAAPLSTPEHRVLDLSMPVGFYATLAGASSPYSWTEQQGTTGGVWQTRVLTGTSNAYEVNGVAGLAGKTVWLEPGWPGDYRFQYVARLASAQEVCVTIHSSCYGYPFLAGATLTLSQSGTTIGTCTTDSLGRCCISAAPGSYTLTIAATGYTTQTQSITLTTGTTFVSYTLVATSNLSCCACSPMPTTLHMTETGPCDAVFNDCTIVYGPTPAEFSGLNLGANCYLSTASFVDSFSGVSYRYNFDCDLIFFRLSRVYEPSSYGPAFHDSTIYSWSIGQPGNTCSPFSLTNGYTFSGGNTDCHVTITA